MLHKLISVTRRISPCSGLNNVMKRRQFDCITTLRNTVEWPVLSESMYVCWLCWCALSVYRKVQQVEYVISIVKYWQYPWHYDSLFHCYIHAATAASVTQFLSVQFSIARSSVMLYSRELTSICMVSWQHVPRWSHWLNPWIPVSYLFPRVVDCTALELWTSWSGRYDTIKSLTWTQKMGDQLYLAHVA